MAKKVSSETQNDYVPSDKEITSVETPESENMSLISEERSPEESIARIETMAALASRWRIAIGKLLIALTYPEDWEIFGEGAKAKAGLSSAGAERMGTQFPIKFFDVHYKRENFTDALGEGYRYLYTGKAVLGERIIFSQGAYSTRDRFLGKADGKYKTLTEINESQIQMAAYHIFQGNAIKGLLGLRAMPVSQYNQLMNASGQDAGKTTGHTYGEGTKGGTAEVDRPQQKELAEACIRIAKEGYIVKCDEKGKCVLEPQDPALVDIAEPVAVAQTICEELSGFTGRDGKKVKGLPASKLAGNRLEITLSKARELLKGLKNG